MPFLCYQFQVVRGNSNLIALIHLLWLFLLLVILYQYLSIRKERKRKERAYSKLTIQSIERVNHKIAEDLQVKIMDHVQVIKMLVDHGEFDMVVSDITAVQENLEMIIEELCPGDIDQLSTTEIIEIQLAKIMRQMDVSVTRNIEPHNLSVQVNFQLYRILQVWINHILKQSNATAISVSLKKQGESLLLKVWYNGNQGEGKDDISSIENHLIDLLNSRAEIIGADVQIYTLPGSATKIVLKIPFTLN